MNAFLRWLRLSMTVSGIVAELVPAISSEFTKREKKKLSVIKVTDVTNSGEFTHPNKPTPEGSAKAEPNIT